MNSDRMFGTEMKKLLLISVFYYGHENIFAECNHFWFGGKCAELCVSSRKVRTRGDRHCSILMDQCKSKLKFKWFQCGAV